MGSLLLEVWWQVDDGDGLEGALLDANTAADAQLLGDGGNLVVDCHLNAKLTHPNNWGLEQVVYMMVELLLIFSKMEQLKTWFTRKLK